MHFGNFQCVYFSTQLFQHNFTTLFQNSNCQKGLEQVEWENYVSILFIFCLIKISQITCQNTLHNIEYIVSKIYGNEWGDFIKKQFLFSMHVKATWFHKDIVYVYLVSIFSHDKEEEEVNGGIEEDW